MGLRVPPTSAGQLFIALRDGVAHGKRNVMKEVVGTQRVVVEIVVLGNLMAVVGTWSRKKPSAFEQTNIFGFFAQDKSL